MALSKKAANEKKRQGKYKKYRASVLEKKVKADVMKIVFPIMGKFREALEADKQERKLNLTQIPTLVANNIVDEVVAYIMKARSSVK